MQGVINTSVNIDQLLDPRIGRTAIDTRLNQLSDPHIAPFTDWVAARRSDPILPTGAGNTIPWVDPDSGGTASRALLLLQDPSRVAANTRFISPDNNDRTAKNVTDVCRSAGLDRTLRLQWNVYPWWVNTKKKGAPQDPERAVETWPPATRVAAELWGSFFTLLPQLRVIATFVDQAKRGWRKAVDAGLEKPTGVIVLHGPSLSPPEFNKSQDGRRNRDIIIATLCRVAEIVE